MNDDSRYKTANTSFDEFYNQEVSDKMRQWAEAGVPEWRMKQEFPHLIEQTNSNIYTKDKPIKTLQF